MSQQISLDIGFDRNLLPKSGNLGSAGEALPQLRYGFTFPDVEGNPVAVSGQFRPGDGMLITLYDLTRDEDGRPEIEFLSLQVSFEKAVEQSATTPVNYVGEASDPLDGVFSRFDIHPGESFPEGCSTVFGGFFPIWNVHPPISSSQDYGGNQLEESRRPPTRSLNVVIGGSFYYSVELQVQAAGKPVKTFKTDPEMVIDTDLSHLPNPCQPQRKGCLGSLFAWRRS